MRITRVTVEFDVSAGEGSVRALRDLLDQYLAHAEPGSAQLSIHERDAPETGVEPAQLARLRRLAEGLTDKQGQVWQVFLAHPGPIAASRLKTLLPDLKQPGALPGVFRATHRWVTQLGGEKGDSPFTQIRWTGSEGIYRGLTPAEAAALQGAAEQA